MLSNTKIQLIIDTTTKHRTKPTGYEIATASNALDRASEKPITIDSATELGELVTQPNGYTFCPAVYKHARNSDTGLFISQQVIALDIDNDNGNDPRKKKKGKPTQPKDVVITLDYILKYCESLNLPPNLIYHTFSHDAIIAPLCPKYRLIWLVNEPITSLADRNILFTGAPEEKVSVRKTTPKTGMLGAFSSLYPDVSCKDWTRLLFGGQDVVYVNDDIYSTMQFEAAINAALYNPNGGSNAFKHLSPPLNNIDSNIIDVYDDRLNLRRQGSSINIYNRTTLLTSIKESGSSTHNTTVTTKNKKSGSRVVVSEKEKPPCEWNEMEWSTQMMKDFASGVELCYPDLFIAVTGMMQFKGGLSWMEETMDAHNKSGSTAYKEKDFVLIYSLQIGRYNHYSPQLLSHSRAYQCDAGFGNIALSIRRKTGARIVAPGVALPSIAEIRLCLLPIIQSFFSDTQPIVSVLAACPGSGKTTSTLAEIPIDIRILVGCRTHALIAECSATLHSLGKPHKCTPAKPHIKSKAYAAFQVDIDRYYAAGMFEDVYTVIDTVITLPFTKPYTEDVALQEADKAALVYYKEETKACYKYDGIVVTTHAKVFHAQGFAHFDTVILDEDPFKNGLLSQSKVSLSVVQGFECSDSSFATDYNTFKDAVALMVDTNIVKNEFMCDEDELKIYIEINKYPSGLLQILKSDYITKVNEELIGITRVDIPANFTRILILDGTACEGKCKAFFKNREIEYHDYRYSSCLGSIEQDTRHSWGISTINKHVKDTGVFPIDVYGLPLMCSKMYSTCDLWWGNARGYNSMKGKSIAIVGDGKAPAYVYALEVAVVHEHRVCPENQRYVRQTVTVDYTTGIAWLPEDLIMSNYIAKELNAESLQAIYRTRLGEHNCVAFVFSGVVIGHPSIVYNRDGNERTQQMQIASNRNEIEHSKVKIVETLPTIVRGVISDGYELGMICTEDIPF